MPAPCYKVFQWGSPIGDGVTGALYVFVAGVAKQSSTPHPYIVANELLCNRLARAILLPVPPGFLLERDGEPCYASLDFNLSGEQLPPANVPRLVNEKPRVAAGIVAFDIWIVNGDRHRRNIAYDTVQSKVHVYDHSHAFFQYPDGRQRLRQNEDRLGLNGHCVAAELNTLAYVEEWINRIRAIPQYYVEEAVKDATDAGLPEGEVDFCVEFLLDRRDRLAGLVDSNRSDFPNVRPDMWNGFAPGGTD